MHTSDTKSVIRSRNHLASMHRENERRLDEALAEIDALQAENEKLYQKNTELSIENICAFGYAYGAGRVSKKDDVSAARELYESGLNGAGR